MPMLARYQHGQLGLAMSGRFTNGAALRVKMKQDGALFTSLSDAELLLQRVAASQQKTLVNRLVDALLTVEGSFCLLLCSEDRLIALRDPRGFRPLLLGRVDGATVFCSEDGPLREIGGEVIREVRAGEMVVVDQNEMVSVSPFPKRDGSRCIHEFVRVARSNAVVLGQAVYPVRTALGERLAKEQPCVAAEVVVGLPGEGVAVALGFARGARIDYFESLVADDDGWTTIPAVVADKRVALVLQSLVTGEEATKAVAALRRAGASEVHVRVASPPVRHGCRYGVSSPTDEEMVSHRIDSRDALGHLLEAASVGFLSIDGLMSIVGRRVDGTPTHCAGCFTGTWPVEIKEPEADQLGLFDSNAPST